MQQQNQLSAVDAVADTVAVAEPAQVVSRPLTSSLSKSSGGSPARAIPLSLPRVPIGFDVVTLRETSSESEAVNSAKSRAGTATTRTRAQRQPRFPEHGLGKSEWWPASGPCKPVIGTGVGARPLWQGGGNRCSPKMPTNSRDLSTITQAMPGLEAMLSLNCSDSTVRHADQAE